MMSGPFGSLIARRAARWVVGLPCCPVCMAHPTTDKEHKTDMHRIGSTGFWTALPLLVVAAWVLAIHGRAAAAGDDSRGAGTALANAPYLSAGVALIRARDARIKGR